MKTSISFLALLLASACNDPSPSDPEDAGTRPADAGAAVPTDGGGADAGAPPADAAAPLDAGAPTDAGPPPATASCDALPATIALGRTTDPYYAAVQLCGTPGASCTIAEDTFASCAGAQVLVGYDFTDAAQVRVQDGWTIVSASAGEPIDARWQRSIPLDEEASVVLEAPGGARHSLTFVVAFDTARIVSFTTAP